MKRGYWIYVKAINFIIIGLLFLVTGIFALIGVDYFMDFLKAFILKDEIGNIKLLFFGYILGGALMIIASVLLLKLKKSTFFLFFISFTVIILSHFLINSLSAIIIGGIFFIWFLWIRGSRKKLRENRRNEEILEKEKDISSQIVASAQTNGKKQIYLDKGSKSEKEEIIESSSNTEVVFDTTEKNKLKETRVHIEKGKEIKKRKVPTLFKKWQTSVPIILLVIAILIIIWFSFSNSTSKSIEVINVDKIENEGIIEKEKTLSNEVLSENNNYNKFLGRYIGDFGMDTAILAIEHIDAQNEMASGYIKTLGEYEDSQNLIGPFKVVNDNSDFRIALSNNYTTYDFYVDGKTVKGDAKDRNGETMYSFSLSKMENSSSNKLAGKTYYTIQDEDGYSNLRNKPYGDILKKVYDSEKFEVIGSEAKHKKVKLNDGTTGYIHESRVVKQVNYRVNLNKGVTNVNVRDNYGTENTKVIDQISYPLSLTVIKEHYLNNEKWIYIKEKNGWILSSFVQSNSSANQNNSINQKIKTNTPFYIISTKAVEEENIAQVEVKNLISRGYNADYLWIPKYKSLSGAELYSVYIGPFYSQFECERAIEEYRKVDGKSYALLVSQENKRVEIRGIGKIKVIEPNQNNKSVLLQTTKYKIRIDNLGNGNYTYTAWPASSSMNDTPNIVVKNGERYEDGSGGNHYYTFTNGNYKYKCSINVLGTDETPPANLLVYNNDDLILSQDAIIK